MWFLLECEDEISAGEVGHLLAFALQNDILTIRHSLFNFNRDFSVVENKTLGLALGALCCHALALAAALIAVSLHLHLHSKSHLYVLEDDTPALAPGTGLQLAVLCASSAALITVDVPAYLQRASGSQIQILERHRNVGSGIWSLLSSWLAPMVSTKKAKVRKRLFESQNLFGAGENVRDENNEVLYLLLISLEVIHTTLIIDLSLLIV